MALGSQLFSGGFGTTALRIQFFAPHPDDIEVFCGGTLLRHYEQHDCLQVLMMSRGGAGTSKSWLKGAKLEEIRTKESEKRFSLLPGVELVWLEFQDGNIRYSPSAVEAVSGKIHSYNPDIIYLPESQLTRSRYFHRDHLHTGQIVEDAARQVGRPVVLRHYHSKVPNCFVNVDAYFKANRAALRMYASQFWFSAFPYPWNMHVLLIQQKLWLKRLGRKIQSKYAEGFREIKSGSRRSENSAG